MTSKLSIRNVKKVYQKKKHAGIGLLKRNFPFHSRSSALTANGEVTAVQHFNLEVEDGEFVVFLGKSGCGKSTLLRMIAGLEEVTEGEIWMEKISQMSIRRTERLPWYFKIIPYMRIFPFMIISHFR